jgi:hypothetical protein
MSANFLQRFDVKETFSSGFQESSASTASGEAVRAFFLSLNFTANVLQVIHETLSPARHGVQHVCVFVQPRHIKKSPEHMCPTNHYVVLVRFRTIGLSFGMKWIRIISMELSVNVLEQGFERALAVPDSR